MGRYIYFSILFTVSSSLSFDRPIGDGPEFIEGAAVPGGEAPYLNSEQLFNLFNIRSQIDDPVLVVLDLLGDNSTSSLNELQQKIIFLSLVLDTPQIVDDVRSRRMILETFKQLRRRRFRLISGALGPGAAEDVSDSDDSDSESDESTSDDSLV